MTLDLESSVSDDPNYRIMFMIEMDDFNHSQYDCRRNDQTK